MRSLDILLKKRYKIFSRDEGGDGLMNHILDVFHSKNLVRFYEPSKFFVEFGAHLETDSGIYCISLIEKGFRGVLIEGDPKRYEGLKEKFKDNDKIEVLNYYVEESGRNSIDRILKETKCPKRFDVLLIDIDSNDYAIFRSMKEYHPLLAIIEFNPRHGIEREIYYNKELTEYFGYATPLRGSSIQAVKKTANEKGYSMIAMLRNNAFFVPDELVQFFHMREVQPKDAYGLTLKQIPYHGLSSLRECFLKFRTYGTKDIPRKLSRIFKKIIKSSPN